MDVSEAQEVKQLRDENARLKRLVAAVCDPKELPVVVRRAEVRRLMVEFAVRPAS
jgi:hypothetical protein